MISFVNSPLLPKSNTWVCSCKLKEKKFHRREEGRERRKANVKFPHEEIFPFLAWKEEFQFTEKLRKFVEKSFLPFFHLSAFIFHYTKFRCFFMCTRPLPKIYALRLAIKITELLHVHDENDDEKNKLKENEKLKTQQFRYLYLIVSLSISFLAFPDCIVIILELPSSYREQQYMTKIASLW